jgi:hypothetical protein
MVGSQLRVLSTGADTNLQTGERTSAEAGGLRAMNLEGDSHKMLHVFATRTFFHWCQWHQFQ